MTDFDELHGYGEELEQRLRLKTFPFAVKLLNKEMEMPEGAIRPKRDLGYHLSLCQGFAMSRREGKTVAMFIEDMWCYSPVLALGIAKPGTADKAVNLERCKSSYRQLPESDG
jgi:uncharacterized protein (DUF169 family)